MEKLQPTESRTMVYITDRLTGLYVRRPSGWSASRQEATCFDNLLIAFDFITKNNLAHADALLAFEDGRYDMRLQIT
jgi:hypothetical protein